MDKPSLPELSDAERMSFHRAVAHLRQTRECDDIPLEQARRARAPFYGLVTQMDQNIGQDRPKYSPPDF